MKTSPVSLVLITLRSGAVTISGISELNCSQYRTRGRNIPDGYEL